MYYIDVAGEEPAGENEMRNTELTFDQKINRAILDAHMAGVLPIPFLPSSWVIAGGGAMVWFVADEVGHLVSQAATKDGAIRLARAAHRAECKARRDVESP